VAATAPERRAFVRGCRNARLAVDRPGAECRTIHTGMGAAAVDRTIPALLGSTVRGLLSVGTAGALATETPAGTLLLPHRITDRDNGCVEVDPGWHDAVLRWLHGQVSPCTDDLLSEDRLIPSPADKSRARARSGAVAADMESAALARLASRHGIPFLVFRVVADTAADTLPAAVVGAVTAAGHFSMAALGTGLLARPGDVPGLVMLAARFRRAAAVLRQASRLAAPALCGYPIQVRIP